MSSPSHRKMESDDQETLFHSYPCSYYVQSPSTISHANSSDLNKANNVEVSALTLSRYSSRGSNNSGFLNDSKKSINGDETGVNCLIVVDGLKEEEEDDDYYYGSNDGFWMTYCSFRRSSSGAWICLQLCWRFLLSLCVALLVFYLATKPPPPAFSIRLGGIQEFGLGEGVDGSGVTTKILTTNCSLNLVIDNKSRLFGLHIHPPLLQMFFGRLPFATSHGQKLYAESHSSSIFELYVGIRNKPMYGAGANMEDLLDLGNGLPISIRLRLSSHFRVVPNLIHPKYHYRAQCLVFLHRKRDSNHRSRIQAHNSTCTIF